VLVGHLARGVGVGVRIEGKKWTRWRGEDARAAGPDVGACRSIGGAAPCVGQPDRHVNGRNVEICIGNRCERSRHRHAIDGCDYPTGATSIDPATRAVMSEAEELETGLESVDHDVVASAWLPALTRHPIRRLPRRPRRADDATGAVLLVAELARDGDRGRHCRRTLPCGRIARRVRRRQVQDCLSHLRSDAFSLVGRPSHDPVSTARSVGKSWACTPCTPMTVPSTHHGHRHVPVLGTPRRPCAPEVSQRFALLLWWCQVGPRDLERHGGRVVHASRADLSERGGIVVVGVAEHESRCCDPEAEEGQYSHSMCPVSPTRERSQHRITTREAVADATNYSSL
jgi:hypothetical protein